MRRLARRATQCDPLDTGMARVGLVLSGADSQRVTVGSRRNVGVDRSLVRVRLCRRAAARALLVREKERTGRGARQMGNKEASVTKMEVGPGERMGGVRVASRAWSVSSPEGEAMERRSRRWMVRGGARGESARGGRLKEVSGGRAWRRL